MQTTYANRDIEKCVADELSLKIRKEEERKKGTQKRGGKLIINKIPLIPPRQWQPHIFNRVIIKQMI